jgi:hypothetical protein
MNIKIAGYRLEKQPTKRRVIGAMCYKQKMIVDLEDGTWLDFELAEVDWTDQL